VTRDEALDLFSAAYDGELSASQRPAFDAGLASDSELRAEFDEFRSLLDETRCLDPDVDVAAPDLLPAVQRKLRARSRGRYYRDRFSATGGKGAALLPLLLAAVMLVVIGVAWFALTYIQVQP
jgi:anti-sigma factor RsiW